MESHIKPFSEVIEEVSERLELTKKLGADAPIRTYSEVYAPDLITDIDELQILTSALSKEAIYFSRMAKGKSIDKDFSNKFDPQSRRFFNGWLLGSEVLWGYDFAGRESLDAYGTVMSEEGVLFNLQSKKMNITKIPRKSAGYNAKAYESKDNAKIFKFSSLKEIKLDKLKDSTGLVVVREQLAEFGAVNNLLKFVEMIDKD